MATKTFIRKIKTNREKSTRETLDATRAYVIRAYGLRDSDNLKISLNRSTGIATATIEVSGPRRGSKWELYYSGVGDEQFRG